MTDDEPQDRTGDDRPADANVGNGDGPWADDEDGPWTDGDGDHPADANVDEDGPWTGGDDHQPVDASTGGEDGPQDRDDDSPLGDLARRIDERRDRRDEEAFMDAFETVEVEEVDADRLWGELEADDLEATVDEPRTEAERDVQVIDKREYCQRCQFFAEPPEMRCTHEGTDIIEMVDTDSFRVADCPIVRGEKNLRDLKR